MTPLFLKKFLIRTGLTRLLPQVGKLTDGGEGFLHYYSNRLLSAPHVELAHALDFLDMHEPGGIDLAAGTPRFDLVPSATTKLPTDRRGYPPALGLPELREAIARHMWQEHELPVRARDEVLITHGATGAFTAAVDTFVNPGDKVVLFDPGSQLYPLVLRSRRAHLRWIPTTVEDGRLRFRLDQLARHLARARMLVLGNPNNPNGGVLAEEDLEQLAWWANHHDVLIFNDATFAAYQYSAEPAPNIGTLSRAQKRTLTAGSVSKSHALASARVGWLVGERHLIAACTVTAALQTPFVPTLCQQLAVTALNMDKSQFAPVLTDFHSRRQYTADRLQAMGLQPRMPAGTFFFWVSISSLGMTGHDFARELLESSRVLVWPGEFFGPSGKNHIRLSYAADDGRLREGLSRMAEFIRQKQRQRPSELPRPKRRPEVEVKSKKVKS